MFIFLPMTISNLKALLTTPNTMAAPMDIDVDPVHQTASLPVPRLPPQALLPLAPISTIAGGSAPSLGGGLAPSLAGTNELGLPSLEEGMARIGGGPGGTLGTGGSTTAGGESSWDVSSSVGAGLGDAAGSRFAKPKALNVSLLQPHCAD